MNKYVMSLYESKLTTIALAIQQCLQLTCLYVLTSSLPDTNHIADYNSVVFKVAELFALSKSIVLICALRTQTFLLFNDWKSWEKQVIFQCCCRVGQILLMHLPNPPQPSLFFTYLIEPQYLKKGMLQRKENIINLP